MALQDTREVKQARERVREREMQPFRQAREAGQASREAREATESAKEGEKEKAGQRHGMRAGA